MVEGNLSHVPPNPKSKVSQNKNKNKNKNPTISQMNNLPDCCPLLILPYYYYFNFLFVAIL